MCYLKIWLQISEFFFRKVNGKRVKLVKILNVELKQVHHPHAILIISYHRGND